jgi:urea transporter
MLRALLVGSLRGVGQVDLQPNLMTSLLILLGLFVGGWHVGLFAFIGTVVSTGAAFVFRVGLTLIAQGLEGFSGCLTGIAMVTFLGHHPSTYLLAVLGALLCTVVTAALTRLLAPYKLSALTAPFCFVAGGIVVGAPAFRRVWYPSPAAAKPGTDTGVSWSELWHALFTNVSQVFLVDNWRTGLIMLIGLVFAGWSVALFAAAGSVVGIFTAWALGAPAGQIAEGLYGYNAVLVAVALGAVFLSRGPWNTLYALAGAAAATFLSATTTAFFTPFGGHTLTWPFIFTTWILLAAIPLLPRFRLRP